jgi:hypothetical protein
MLVALSILLQQWVQKDFQAVSLTGITIEYGFTAYVCTEARHAGRDLWNFYPQSPGDGYTDNCACN